jgi:hypothetical protein
LFAVDAVALRRTITASLSYQDWRKMLRSYRPTIARASLMKARHPAPSALARHGRRAS